MPFIDPFQNKLCPFCFTEFHLSDCAIVSAIEDHSSGENPVIQFPPEGWRKWLARFWINPPSGTENAKRIARWRCPHCGTLLPLNIANVNNRIVALVGGSESGKTTYIASLVEQLHRGRELSSIGCTEFIAMNSEVDMIYRKYYYQPTFIEKRRLPGTISQRTAGPEDPYHKPLVYSLAFEHHANRQRQSINLVLFDASGEDFESDESLAQFTQYVMHAAAIIFLIDPMSIRGLRDQVPPHIRDMAEPGMEARSVMHNVLRILRQSTGNDVVSIPVALTLTKSDLLRYALAGLPNYNNQTGAKPLILQDPDYSHGFEVAEYQEVSRQVEELVTCLDGPGLSQQRQVFPNLSFSAVSATGCPPDEEGVYKFVKPTRCLDPLFWVFWQLGLITPAQPAEQQSPLTHRIPRNVDTDMEY